MNKNDKILILGSQGMVGSSIVRQLKKLGHTNLICHTHRQVDLTNQLHTDYFFESERPEYVFLAAAKVGGIMSHVNHKAEYIYDNLLMECNVIHAAHKYGIRKLLFIGSSCIYPKLSTKPLVEEDLLSGYLEPTNEPYAVAKIAGIKLCESYREQYGSNFISIQPCNLYGQGDNYGKNNTHVLPSLLRRFHEAKINNLPEVIVWGTGNPYREFMYSDDMADACIFLMNNYNGKLFINAGTGEDITIKELAYMIKEEVGYDGNIVFDTTKPDGTLRKVMDITRLHEMGWKHKVSLKEGIKLAYYFFKEDYININQQYENTR